MPAGVLTEHRVAHPEITLDDGDEAEGRWYLQDRVIVPEHNFMLFGAAFYRDRYRKTSDGWKICATGYQRTTRWPRSEGTVTPDRRWPPSLGNRDHRAGLQPADDLDQAPSSRATHPVAPPLVVWTKNAPPSPRCVPC